MRRRLLLVLLPLLTALLVALEVPLAQTHAARLTQDRFIDGVVDAQRFAGLGDQVLRNVAGRGALDQEARNYARFAESRVAIVDQEVNLLLPHRAAAVSPATRVALLSALAGGDPVRPPTAWPWRSGPIRIGVPIGQGANIIGAVVVEVPTGHIRAQVFSRIALLAALGIAVLILATALAAMRVARWVLRPVDELNATAARLTAGELSARAAERGGPPELRDLAVAVNAMAAALGAALERQRAFVADASHELRNPLATLRLRIESLAERLGGDDERELRVAIAESDRLARTVTRLLELARAEATAAEHGDFDVVALLEQRLAAWTPRLERSAIAVRVSAAGEVRGHGSADAVEYALDVLLDNACSYAAGSPLDIAISADNGYVELRIRDYGTGASEAEVGRIGERFWRGTSHRSEPGTGLGVATARALLHSSGAELDVAAASPGLVVTLRLPAATAPPRTIAPHPDATPADTS